MGAVEEELYQVRNQSSQDPLNYPIKLNNKIAALTGHATADDHLAVLAEAARAVSWELHRTIRAAEAAVAPGGSSTRGQGSERRPAITRVGNGVIVQAGEISVDPRGTDPLRDLAAVRHAATTGLPLADATLDRIAQSPERPLSAAQRDVFVDALAGEHIADVYEALDVKGIFERWVPGWHEVRNRPQRSAVHRFTVDRHQIETVKEAQRFLPKVARPDLLLITALVHDLGKTREFTYGAEIGLSEEGRLLGHVVLGQRMLDERTAGMDPDKRLALAHCVLCHHGPDAAPGRRFGSAEALALYRINALDTTVKGALEHGLNLRD